MNEGGGGGTFSQSLPPLNLRGIDRGSSSSSDEDEYKMNNYGEEDKLVVPSDTFKVAAHFHKSSD